jgi:hypothetical protein
MVDDVFEKFIRAITCTVSLPAKNHVCQCGENRFLENGYDMRHFAPNTNPKAYISGSFSSFRPSSCTKAFTH